MGKRIYPAGLKKSMMILYKYLLNNKGSFMLAHLGQGSLCYKMMDVNMNPIRIYTRTLVDEMIEKGFLVKANHKVTLAPNGMNEQRDETINRKVYSFGKITDYKKGDIVYCKGSIDCVGVVQCRAAFDKEKPDDIRFFISKKLSNVSYKDMRYAKKNEILLLGKRRVIGVIESENK
jgi:hypothetical protein